MHEKCIRLTYLTCCAVFWQKKGTTLCKKVGICPVSFLFWELPDSYDPTFNEGK